MRFHVDPSSPTPPSRQLADQVRFAVCAGRLAVGDRLPSVRALAAEVRVNPNTIGRAWRELEREGVVEARRGAGIYVVPGGPQVCRRLCDRLIAERLGRAVGEALAAGLGAEEVAELVCDALEAWSAVHSQAEVPRDGRSERHSDG